MWASDADGLHAETRNDRGNIVRPQSTGFHAFLEAEHGALPTIVDDVAKRSRADGGRPFERLFDSFRHPRPRGA